MGGRIFQQIATGIGFADTACLGFEDQVFEFGVGDRAGSAAGMRSIQGHKALHLERR